MDKSEIKETDVENTGSPGEDLHDEKVITTTSKIEENSNPESLDAVEEEIPKKGKGKKDKKLKKAEKKLNKKYADLKDTLAKWLGKASHFSELAMKKEALVKDLQEVINQSVELQESGKNIKSLKKVMKRINRSIKTDGQAEKIKNRIRKLEKKIGRIEKKMA